MRSKTHTRMFHMPIENICCRCNSRYCSQLIVPCYIQYIVQFEGPLFRLLFCFSTWKMKWLKLKTFDIPSHQSNELWIHFQHYLMETTHCLIQHPSVHPNTRGTTPPCSQDNIRPRTSGPARVQVREIVFPHLSFLPMNEALSAEEWDPYLPFGIAHVVTNQKQMSRQVALCSDCVC